jgi:pyruvate dehydrogenase E1 component
MMECVDGEYQTFKAKNGAYVREHFFNTPELKEWSPTGPTTTSGTEPRRPRPAQGLRRLPRAVKHKGQPTVILAKTIKGFGMGQAGEAMNISHQQKKMDDDRSAASATASTSRSPTTNWKSCPT